MLHNISWPTPSARDTPSRRARVRRGSPRGRTVASIIRPNHHRAPSIEHAGRECRRANARQLRQHAAQLDVQVAFERQLGGMAAAVEHVPMTSARAGASERQEASTGAMTAAAPTQQAEPRLPQLPKQKQKRTPQFTGEEQVRRGSIASARTYGSWTEQCSICLSPPIDPETTPCGHSFCRRCLQQVKRRTPAREQPKCPECRGLLPRGRYGTSSSRSSSFPEPRAGGAGAASPRARYVRANTSSSPVGARARALEERLGFVRSSFQPSPRNGRVPSPPVSPPSPHNATLISTLFLEVSEYSRAIEERRAQRRRRTQPALAAAPTQAFARGRDIETMPVPVRLSEPSVGGEGSAFNFVIRNSLNVRKSPIVDAAGFASVHSWTIGILPDTIDYSRAPRYQWVNRNGEVMREAVPERHESVRDLASVIEKVEYTDVSAGEPKAWTTQVSEYPPFECRWNHFGSSGLNSVKGELISPAVRPSHERLARSARYRADGTICCPEVRLRPLAVGVFQVRATIHWREVLHLPPSAVTIELRSPQQEEPQARPQVSPAAAAALVAAALPVRVRVGGRADANNTPLLHAIVNMANASYTLANMEVFNQQTLCNMLVPPGSMRQRLVPRQDVFGGSFEALQCWTPEQMEADLSDSDGRSVERAVSQDGRAVVMLLAMCGQRIAGCLKLTIEVAQHHSRRPMPPAEGSDAPEENQEEPEPELIAHISAMAVSNERQGEGIATRLLRTAEKHCRENRIRTLSTSYYRRFQGESGGGDAFNGHAERLRSWFANLGFTVASNTRHNRLQMGHLQVPSSTPLWRESCRKEIALDAAAEEEPPTEWIARSRAGATAALHGLARSRHTQPAVENVEHYEIHIG